MIFPKEDIQVANKYLKRCSTSLLREMQIIKMAIIKMIRNNKCWWRCGENGTLTHDWWECKLMQAIMKDSMVSPQKIKNRTTIWPTYDSIYVKKPKTSNPKGKCTPMFRASLFTIAKTWKWPKSPSIDEWMKNIWYIYNGI